MSDTLVACEICDQPFEDHPLAFSPHVCPECGGDLEEDDGAFTDDEWLFL